jgi:hypothetical protein
MTLAIPVGNISSAIDWVLDSHFTEDITKHSANGVAITKHPNTLRFHQSVSERRICNTFPRNPDDSL